jgi:hypothetical protein
MTGLGDDPNRRRTFDGVMMSLATAVAPSANTSRSGVDSRCSRHRNILIFNSLENDAECIPVAASWFEGKPDVALTGPWG